MHSNDFVHFPTISWHSSFPEDTSAVMVWIWWSHSSQRLETVLVVPIADCLCLPLSPGTWDSLRRPVPGQHMSWEPGTLTV